MKQSGKKALSYFLTLLMVLSCLTALTPSLAAYALDEEERVGALLAVANDSGDVIRSGIYGVYDWSLNITTGVLTISGDGNMPNASSSENVPWLSYNGFIKSVEFSGDVKNICYYAFYNCRNLTEITIPDSVTSIGGYAFRGCSSLTNVTIPDGVISIGYDAFSGCSGLTSVTIPDSVTSIGSSAFYCCSSLTSITIPDSVTSIGSSAFYGCYNLKNVNISDLAAWCKISFSGSSSNPLYYAHDFYLDGELVNELVIPDSVTNIGNYAFYNCSSLTSVTIPDSVTRISSYSFSGCTNMTDIYILNPNCVIEGNSIPANAVIHGYSGSTAHNYALNNGLRFESHIHGETMTVPGVEATCTQVGYTSGEKCIECGNFVSGHEVIPALGHILTYYETTSEATCTKNAIGIAECDRCGETYSGEITGSALGHTDENNDLVCDICNDYCGTSTLYSSGKCGANVTYKLYNDGVLIISGSGAMYNYGYGSYPWYSYRSYVESVIVYDSVTSIGNYAFYNCSRLTRVTIPDSVTIINDYAFPSGVVFVGHMNSVINNCLKKYGGSFAHTEDCEFVTVNNIEPTCTEKGYITAEKCVDCGYYVSGQVSAAALGHTDTNYDNYCERCNEYCGTSILYASGSCGDNVTYKLYNDGMLVISGTGAMYSYNRTNSLFYSYRYKIRNVVITDGVTKIGNSAFYGCDYLSSVKISNTVKTIGSYAFYNCKYNLTSVSIPNSVRTIGTGAFYRCYNLKNVTLGKRVNKIGVGAFKYCSRLSSVSIPDSVKTIGDRAFYDCYNLKSVKFGKSVEIIGSDAFRYCSSLSSVSIPDSVQSVGNSAFYNCYNLETAKLGESVETIGDYAFYYCRRLKSVSLGESLKTIGNSAFYHCNKLVSVKLGKSVEAIGDFAFIDCRSLENVYISDIGSWCEINFADCYSNPLYYANNLFVNGEVLKEIIIPDSVEQINSYAFYNYRISTDVVIPDSVKTIGDYAFYRCGVKNATIGNSVETIGSYAFYNCRTMTDVVIPDSVTSIGDYAFYHCGVETATIGNSVETIGRYAFAQCRTMTDVVIPDSVIKLGRCSFYCAGIESAVVGKSVEKIDSTVFAECRTMTDITILNPDCNITEHETTFPTKATIHGYHNSTAYRYSYLYNRHFDFLDDHTLKAEFTLPESCISHGFSVMKCEFCDYKTNELIAPSGHIDHDNDGVCDICALGLTGGCRHDFTSAYIAPTCTEPGYMSLTCSLCGESYRNETDSALGHTYDSGVVTPPTATENGYITYTCVVCGDSYIENTLLPENAPVISVSTEKCLDGKTVDVTISVKNNPGVVNMQLTVSYDTPLKLVKVTDGEILGEEMHVPNLNRNPYYLTWANDLATENFTEDGVLATLTFEVPEGTEEGDYGISVAYSGIDYDIVNKDFETVDFYTINGSVNVVNYIVCDANGDGIVNTADRMLIARYTAKWDGYDEQISDIRALDVNGDGRVNTADRMILSRALAKWTGYDVYLK